MAKTRTSINQEAKELLQELGTHNLDLDLAVVNRRVATAAGRDIILAEYLEQALQSVFKKGYCTPKPYTGKKHKKHQRIVNVVVSDTHFQSLLDPEECPIGYRALQESRRLGKVAQQVADFKPQYRAESKLMVHLLGDLIQGQLHDPRDGSPLAMQVAACIHYITQFLMFCAQQYPDVEVFCTPGNHGRNMHRHKDRAVFQKWDSIETMVYIAVKAAIKTSGLKNIKINIDKRPYYTVKLFDNMAFFTHGDTVLKPGFPGKSIDTKSLFQQICRWNTARDIGGPFHLFVTGHVHFGSITNMPSGIVMMTNGCLVPPDPFSLSIGAPDVTCGQYLFESVEGHVVGDQRFIRLDDADVNPTYNDYITPFGDTL